jgi:hypothetical protein
MNPRLYHIFLFSNTDFISFRGVIPEGKHVMLSYHQNNQEYVAKIYRILQDEHIPVWFNEYKDMYNMHNR